MGTTFEKEGSDVIMRDWLAVHVTAARYLHNRRTQEQKPKTQSYDTRPCMVAYDTRPCMVACKTKKLIACILFFITYVLD